MSKIPHITKEGLTYDDVLLIPAYSEVLPRKTDITSTFSRNIKLHIPIISAAMDSVTEYQMAIAMAREGGIGVLHKNMTIEEQVKQVRKVKRSESGMIIDPVAIQLDAKVSDAKNIMKEHNIGGIPIVNEHNLLKGIVTNRDLRFEENDEKPIVEVMTKKLITTKETRIDLAKKILHQHKIEKLPVVDNNFKLVGLITYRDIEKLTQTPYANKDRYKRLRVATAVGVTNDSMERVEALSEVDVDAIVIDTAHGHTKNVADLLKKIKSKYSHFDTVVGNIATPQAANFLVENGADALKVGIGPGSICTTRVVTGVGYPQLSAILEIKSGLKDKTIPIIADGGIRYTGDISKAIAAGSDSVMLGSMLAGTKEAPGETVIYEGRKFKNYRGMGSISAMESGSKDRYFQDMEDDVKKLVPEGIEGLVPYKSEVSESITQFVGGIRAAMGYCGAKNIQMLKKATFVKITNSSIAESHPHDVHITKEAPNYSRK